MHAGEGEADRGRDDPARGSVRCECLRCGAHTYAIAIDGGRLKGHCGNCGGTELVPLDTKDQQGGTPTGAGNDFEDRSIDA
jgi:hypothetical protein